MDKKMIKKFEDKKVFFPFNRFRFSIEAIRKKFWKNTNFSELFVEQTKENGALKRPEKLPKKIREKDF